MGERTDTASVQYLQLKTQRAENVKIRRDNETEREKKLEPLTLLSDIFLRLIKMIVAPLVFTTLVVGVAKVGDIKAVGRIGGKNHALVYECFLIVFIFGNDHGQHIQTG